MALTKKELRQFLADHPRQQFADWLLAVAKDSPDFKQRLNFYVATHQSWEVAAKSTLEAIEQFSRLQTSRVPVKPAELVKQSRFLLESLRACIDFDPDAGLGHMVEMVMVSLDQMCDQGGREQARLDELQREFASLHLRVCKMHPPPPLELAETIFKLRSGAEGQILPDAPKAYLDLLGPAGLDRYRQLLEPTYQVLLYGPANRHRHHRDTRQFLNRRLMVFEWATITTDVDEQVAILLAMSRNPDDVLTVAAYLESRQRPMDAIDITRQAHQKTPSLKLAKFLANRLEGQNQAGEALNYRWYLLEHSPSKETFDDLMHAAGQARQLAEWRERAMAYAATNSKGLYIELLLGEDRLDEALSEARQHGARLSLWARLANGYVVKEPRLAIELFFDCAEFSLKERQPDSHIASAWQLAIDNATFQIFRARILSFFQNHKVSERYIAKLVEAGIPVAKLLGSLDTKSRKD